MSFSVTKCSNINCMTCSNLFCFSNFIFINNVQVFLNSNLTCKSTHAIYVIFCSSCSLFYVGKSQTSVNVRFNKHRSDLNSTQIDSLLPVTKHLKSCSNKHFSFSLIYQQLSFDNFDFCSAENYFKLLLKPPLNVQ